MARWSEVRRDNRDTEYRILLTTQWLGGDGGAERAAAGMIRALRHHHVDVLAAQHIRNRNFALPERGSAPHRLRWRAPRRSRPVQRLWRLASPAFRFRPSPYDAHVAFAIGPQPTIPITARVRAIHAMGMNVYEREDAFDVVFVEAIGNIGELTSPSKAVLMPPPLEPSRTQATAPSNSPKEFLLTVFNPYGRVKGTDLLAEVADHSHLPVVWCHGTATRDWSVEAKLLSHPNIIHVVDASEPELVFLYQHCTAYVSLSRSEGFGWAVADALQYGAPVISRQTGILTSPEIDRTSVVVYETEDQLMSIVASPPEGHIQRDLSFLQPREFARRFDAWLTDALGPK